MKIVVTYKVFPEERNIYTEFPHPETEFIFLKDIDAAKRVDVFKTAEILLTWIFSRELNEKEINFLGNIRFAQLLTAGYDHLNLDLFPPSCIIASNQGAYAEPMAEHTVAMILALSKRLLINHRKMMNGEFDQRTPAMTLKNSVCGIIGFGSIGKAVANLLKYFGVNIFAINTSGRTNEEVEFIGTLKDLDYVLKNSDVVLLSIPLDNLTRDLFGRRELEIMKPNAILINVARGAIIKEKDLYEHLKTHSDFMAGLDAWWKEPFHSGEFKLSFPFFDLPNVLGSPHNSAIIPGALFEGQKRALENIGKFLSGKEIKGIIRRS